jgi:hypothetical protein
MNERCTLNRMGKKISVYVCDKFWMDSLKCVVSLVSHWSIIIFQILESGKKEMRIKILTAHVTGLNGGCLLLLKHLILPLVCPGVHVCLFMSLTCNIPTCVLRLITVWYLNHFILLFFTDNDADRTPKNCPSATTGQGRQKAWPLLGVRGCRPDAIDADFCTNCSLVGLYMVCHW